jgi:hypothetical protein
LTLSTFLPPPDSPPQGLGDIQVGYISKWWWHFGRRQ